jgi:flagellin
MSQAIENSQNASNMVNTADAALGEVRNLLLNIRESALASIGASSETTAAEQDTVNNAISSINRIASTTRFGTRPLLNGAASFNITAKSADLTELNINQVMFAGASEITFTVNVAEAAHQATLSGIGATVASGGTATIELRGVLGVETLTLGSGMTAAEFGSAVNAVRDNTGVYASGNSLYSEEFGTAATISLTVTSGTSAYTGPSGVATGADITAYVNGVPTVGTGRELSVTSTIITGNIRFAPDVASGASLSFTVRSSGLGFQLGTTANPIDQITMGIQNVSPRNLGTPVETVGGKTIGGYLSSLTAGGENDLYTNPENAVRIVDEAMNDVNRLSANLGAVQGFTIQPNINALEVGFQELTKSMSSIMDLDYASEITNFIRNQVMQQAGILVLGQANTTPNLVLDLLGSVAKTR